MITQLAGQPIEQLGMRGRATHPTEVVRRVAKATAEVIVPDTVRDAAPCERVLLVCDPIGQSRAPRRFVSTVSLGKPCRERVNGTQRTAQGFLERLIELATFQDVYRFRRRNASRRSLADSEQDICLRCCCIDHEGRGQFRKFVVRNNSRHKCCEYELLGFVSLVDRNLKCLRDQIGHHGGRGTGRRCVRG